MVVSCAVCKQAIGVVFLEKIAGTFERKDGKRIAVCSACQRKQAITAEK